MKGAYDKYICLFVCFETGPLFVTQTGMECCNLFCLIGQSGYSLYLHLLDSSDSHALASQVAGIIGVCQHARLISVFLVETRFCHVAHAGLELLIHLPQPPKVLGLWV